MNRSTFFGRLVMLMGAGISIPGVLSASSNSLAVTHKPFIKVNGNRGVEPIFYKTPWGQKVVYDRYTYGDMKKAEWIKKGINW